MKCEICQQRDATISMSQDVNGEKKELHICQRCAVQNREMVSSVFPLADLLFGISSAEIAEAIGPVNRRRCPSCGMSRLDFKTRERLGCPVCYRTHAPEVNAMIGDMQGADRHVGKVPASYKAAAELSSLKSKLTEAVATEHYEAAAVLRDRIKDFEVQGK